MDINGSTAGDHSGYAVALSGDGDRVAIGAPTNNDNGTNSGQVRVFQNLSGGWIQLAANLGGEAADDQFGHSLSLSANGIFLAVGAPGNDENAIDAGQVKVFQYFNGAWEQVGDDLLGEAANDQFGSSVSISANGNRVAVGAPNNGGNGIQSGHVRVFQNVGGLWIQTGQDLDGEAENDLSGSAISLSGDGNKLSIGAPGNDGNGADAGHVRVYGYLDSTWVQIGDDIDAGVAADASGFAVSLSYNGNKVAIGAEGSLGGGTANGYVKVYQKTGETWTQNGPTIVGEGPGDFFGYSVSLSGNGGKLAVGAIYNNGNGIHSGHTRVLEYDGLVWKQIGSDINGEAGNDQSGKSVCLSIDGKRVAIGADFNNGNGAASGHVRVYKNLCNPADLNGDGIVNSSDFLVLLGSFNTICAGCVADINQDGFISVSDFLLLLSNFGSSCS